MNRGDAATGLAGQRIKEIFRAAPAIAELHACLTGGGGDNFRFRLLQAAETPLEEETIERIRAESQIKEYHRHFNALLKFGLMKLRDAGGPREYVRSASGESAVNVVREFEHRIGSPGAEAVHKASLGPNSIRLFLRVYGDNKKADWGHRQIRYEPAEVGRLSLFLPRVIEGISAIDKLNECGLLVYEEDGGVYMPAVKARSFYQYLQGLYEVLDTDWNAESESGAAVSPEAAPRRG